MNNKYNTMGKIARVCNIIAIISIIVGIIVYFATKQFEYVFQACYKSVEVGSSQFGSISLPKYERVPDTGAQIFRSIGLIAIFICPLSLALSFREFDNYSRTPLPTITIVNLILSSILFRWLYASLITQAFGLGAYSIGYMCNIGVICSIIINIIRIMLIVENISDSHKYKKQKLAEQSNITTTQSFLDAVGTAVFVKYYDLWRDWAVIDLIDKLNEPYSEESKKSRITAAKSIFSNNNQVLALELICKKQAGIDESTKRTAQTLLNKERQKNSVHEQNSKN